MAANYDLEANEALSKRSEKVAIIGTGTYGISIGKRLLHFGFEVIYGSRRPNYEYVKECLNNDQSKFNVTSIKEAWDKSDDIVILAISAEDSVYENFADEITNHLKETESNLAKKSKIIIEISNLLDSVDSKNVKISNAEKLEQIFKDKFRKHKFDGYNINIVKGFNLINSYSMSSFIDELDKSSLSNLDLNVPISGDDQTSKQMIIDLCNRIGLKANDMGTLRQSALKLELSNKKTFDDWVYPSLYSLLFLAFNFVWIFIIYFVFPKKPLSFKEYLNDFSLLSHLNKVLGFTAINILAFVYFANVVASIYQLKYSTKYKKFPRYLDFWLKTRKQFGLLAFLIASFHAMASIYVTNPLYLKDWYMKLNNNGIGKMTLNGELNILTGIVAYLLMVLVALSSINSIANSLNWSEWRFVQTKIGLSCLSMAFLHDAFMYIRIFNERVEYNYDFVYLITRVKLIALYFPLIVLVARFVLTYFRPLSTRLENIRNGKISSNLA